MDLTEWGVGAMAANPDEDAPPGEDSRRLAVLDLDWSQVRAFPSWLVEALEHWG